MCIVACRLKHKLLFYRHFLSKSTRICFSVLFPCSHWKVAHLCGLWSSSPALCKYASPAPPCGTEKKIKVDETTHDHVSVSQFLLSPGLYLTFETKCHPKKRIYSRLKIWLNTKGVHPATLFCRMNSNRWTHMLVGPFAIYLKGI